MVFATCMNMNTLKEKPNMKNIIYTKIKYGFIFIQMYLRITGTRVFPGTAAVSRARHVEGGKIYQGAVGLYQVPGTVIACILL